MLFSFCGVNLIAFGEGGALKFEIGAIYVFAAAVCTSIYFVIQKPLLARYGSFEMTSYSIWVGTAVMLPCFPGLAGAIGSARVASTLTVIYLGVFPAALAYFFWSYVLARFPASRSVSFLYLVPVVATLLAYLWLGEVPSPLSITGGCFSLTGVVILNRFGGISAAGMGGEPAGRDGPSAPGGNRQAE
jgi:drug/metabolite transporter (DMT)-like permease